MGSRMLGRRAMPYDSRVFLAGRHVIERRKSLHGCLADIRHGIAAGVGTLRPHGGV